MPNNNTSNAESRAPKIRTIWKTKPEPGEGKSGNQDRLVLQVSETHVFYASRGGNILNEFNAGERCHIDSFLKIANFDRPATEAEWAQARETLASWIKAKGLSL